MYLHRGVLSTRPKKHRDYVEVTKLTINRIASTAPEKLKEIAQYVAVILKGNKTVDKLSLCLEESLAAG